MSVTTARKQEIIKEYQTKEGDTGSPEVQVAIMTERINDLSAHMQQHPKDLGSRRGLLSLVANRRSLLDYLKNIDQDRYQNLIQRLGLRR